MMWNGEMSSLVDELKRGGWSCVIGNAGRMTTYSKRGVADLYRILVSEPELLLNSYIADKVVGKGAAALMVLGKVSRLHTHIISIPALVLLRNAGIHVDYDIKVEYIINREGNGRCPVETLCDRTDNPEEMLRLIGGFLSSVRS